MPAKDASSFGPIVVDCPKCKRTIWAHVGCRECEAREEIEGRVYELPPAALRGDSDQTTKRK